MSIFKKELLKVLITIQMGAPAGALALTHGSVTSPPSPGLRLGKLRGRGKKKEKGNRNGFPGGRAREGAWMWEREDGIPAGEELSLPRRG